LKGLAEKLNTLIESSVKMKVYHGTNAAPFKKFDSAKFGMATDSGHLGRGAYFSTDPRSMRGYKTHIQATISLRNPLRVSLPDFRTNKQRVVCMALGIDKELVGSALTKQVKSAGYDGVILDYSSTGYKHQEIVVYDANQVKIDSAVPANVKNESVLYEARPIKIDKDGARETAKRLTDALRNHLEAIRGDYGTGDRELGEVRQIGPIMTADIVDVLGRDQRINIVMLAKKARTHHWIAGGGIGVHKGSGKLHGQPVIAVVLNGSSTIDSFLSVVDGLLRKKIYEMLIHELTHAADVRNPKWRVHGKKERGFKPPKPGEYGSYFNDPGEVRAYMQEIADQVIEFVSKNRSTLSRIASSNKIVQWAIKSSETWQNIKDELNLKNRKLIIKAVYTALQDAGLIGGSVEEAWSDLRDRVLAWVDSQGDPMVLYRAINVPLAQVNWNALGRFWTPEKGKADSPYGKGTERVVLMVKAKRKDVDEKGTISNMSRYGGEREIRLLPSTKVKVIGAYVEGKLHKLNKTANVGTKDFAEAAPDANLKMATATEKDQDGDHWTFKTGSAVKFRFMRNTESSQNFGGGFDQEYEPYGTFMLSDSSGSWKHPIKNWIYGWAQFRKPLVIAHVTTRGEGGWKQRLATHFNAGGRALTKALLKAGYDAVVTVNTSYKEASEIVALKKSWRVK